MKILDRYMIRELVIPIVFCSISLIMFFIIADVFDNLDEMLKNNTKNIYIFQYYLNIVPVAFSQTITWATLLGTIFILFNFNRHNEMLAMKAAGMNIESIMVPLLYVGLVIGILTFVVNDRVVPKTYLVAKDIKISQIEKNKGKEQGLTLYDVTYFSPDNQLYYLQSLETKKNIATNIVIVYLNSDKKAEKKLVAKEATWNNGTWDLKFVTAYEMNDQGRIIGEPQMVAELNAPELKVTPEELIETSREGVFLSYKELKGQIERLKEHQFKLNAEEVELNNKLAIPWHSLVMILIAVPLLSGTAQRKLFAINLSKCFLVVLGFHFLTAIALALGNSGVLWPPIAAWIVPTLFGSASVFFLETANR